MWNNNSKEISFNGYVNLETDFGIHVGDTVEIKLNSVEEGTFVYKGNGLFVSAFQELGDRVKVEDNKQECYECDGLGTLCCEDCNGLGCTLCDGGSFICEICNGTGFLVSDKGDCNDN